MKPYWSLSCLLLRILTLGQVLCVLIQLIMAVQSLIVWIIENSMYFISSMSVFLFFSHDQARGYYGQSPLGMSDKIDLKLMLDRQDLEVPKLS